MNYFSQPSSSSKEASSPNLFARVSENNNQNSQFAWIGAEQQYQQQSQQQNVLNSAASIQPTSSIWWTSVAQHNAQNLQYQQNPFQLAFQSQLPQHGGSQIGSFNQLHSQQPNASQNQSFTAPAVNSTSYLHSLNQWQQQIANNQTFKAPPMNVPPPPPSLPPHAVLRPQINTNSKINIDTAQPQPSSLQPPPPPPPPPLPPPLPPPPLPSLVKEIQPQRTVSTISDEKDFHYLKPSKQDQGLLLSQKPLYSESKLESGTKEVKKPSTSVNANTHSFTANDKKKRHNRRPRNRERIKRIRNLRKAAKHLHASGISFDPDVDFDVIARRTPGFTVVQMRNLLNEAANAAARLQKSTVGMQQIDAAIDRIAAGSENRSGTLMQDAGRNELLEQGLSTSEPPHMKIPSNNIPDSNYLHFHLRDDREFQETDTSFQGKSIFLPTMSSNQNQTHVDKKDANTATETEGDFDSVSIIESVQMDISFDSNSLDQPQQIPSEHTGSKDESDPAQKRMKTSSFDNETPGLYLQSPAMSAKAVVIDNVPPLFTSQVDEPKCRNSEPKYGMYSDQKEKLSRSYWKMERPRSPSAVHQNVVEWAGKSPTSAYNDDDKTFKKIKVNNNWWYHKSEVKDTVSQLGDQQNPTSYKKSVMKEGVLQNQKKNKNERVRASRWGKPVAKHDRKENTQVPNLTRSIFEEKVAKGSNEFAIDTPKSYESESSQDDIDLSKQAKPNHTKSVSKELAEIRARVLRSIKLVALKKKEAEEAEAEARRKIASRKSTDFILKKIKANKSPTRSEDSQINSGSRSSEKPLEDITALSQRIFIKNISQSGPASKVRKNEENEYGAKHKERDHIEVETKMNAANSSKKENVAAVSSNLVIEENKRQNDAIRIKLERLKELLAAKVREKTAKQATILSTHQKTPNNPFTDRESLNEKKPDAKQHNIPSRKETDTVLLTNGEEKEKRCLSIIPQLRAISPVKGVLNRNDLRGANDEMIPVAHTQSSQKHLILMKQKRDLRNAIDVSKMKNIRTQQDSLRKIHLAKLQETELRLEDCTKEIEIEKKIISMKEAQMKALLKKKAIMENMLTKMNHKLMNTRKRLRDCKQEQMPTQAIAEAHHPKTKRGRASDFF